MKPQAMQIIRDEHLAIAAVLFALRFCVRKIRDEGKAADFVLLRAILDYIVSYPDRWHHPKEDQFLFAAVRARTHEADHLLATLQEEHRQGHPMIEDLKHQLLAFERGEPGANAAFCAAAEKYARMEWGHMRREEDLLLPIAEKVLTEEDWERIHSAFRENDNPLFGIKPKDEAERLYRTILSLAPAPIGYAK